ncbi:MAG: V-type ATP synthase subunit D [Candidatus Omnitrophica bacterium]|jgi:V/A-type H+-transporting ATPase subunit D|nr:V-type ATP synthase subunit D [Candidatus Omnitrophota bacterium]
MPKIKLTKGELKKQRDALRAYQRYLPTLLLKKQQLQIEILHRAAVILAKEKQASRKKEEGFLWWGLLVESPINFQELLSLRQVLVSSKNVAGVDLPVFEKTKFQEAEYDLFQSPLWLDQAWSFIKEEACLLDEIKTLSEGLEILRRELRVTTQRVNLFEKVKIPQAKETIRVIKIYIGDQMANAVGRSKIAKAKIEAYEAEGALV